MREDLLRNLSLVSLRTDRDQDRELEGLASEFDTLASAAAELTTDIGALEEAVALSAQELDSFSVPAGGSALAIDVEKGDGSGNRDTVANFSSTGMTLTSTGNANNVLCSTVGGTDVSHFNIRNQAGSASTPPYVEFAATKVGSATSQQDSHSYRWKVDTVERMRLTAVDNNTSELTDYRSVHPSAPVLKWKGGVIGTEYGGTGLHTYALSDILYYDSGTGSMAKLAVGNSDQVLRVGVDSSKNIYATVDLSNQSSVISLYAPNTSLAVGMLASGTGIPADAVVTSVSGNTVTLSAAATSTITASPITFKTLQPLWQDEAGSYWTVSNVVNFGSGGTYRTVSLGSSVLAGTTYNTATLDLKAGIERVLIGDNLKIWLPTSVHSQGEQTVVEYMNNISFPQGGTSTDYVAFGSLSGANTAILSAGDIVVIGGTKDIASLSGSNTTANPNGYAKFTSSQFEVACDGNDDPYLGFSRTGDYGNIYCPASITYKNTYDTGSLASANNQSGAIMSCHKNGTYMCFNLTNNTYKESDNTFAWRSSSSDRMKLRGGMNPALRLFATPSHTLANGDPASNVNYMSFGMGSTFPSSGFKYWNGRSIPIGTAMYIGGNNTNDHEGTLLAMNGEGMMISNPADAMALGFWDEDVGTLSWFINSAGSLGTGSDSRRKRDISTYKNANFERFKQIRTVSYKTKIPTDIQPTRLEKQSCIDKYNEMHYGIIAQEFFELYPELESSCDVKKRDAFYQRRGNWDNGVYEQEHEEWKKKKEKFEKDNEDEKDKAKFADPEPQRIFNEEEPLRSFEYNRMSVLTVGVVQDLIKENENLARELRTVNEEFQSMKKLLRKHNIF